jgi:uroporphyrin-III C-methyltransferase / precorrin-2 dehydrogenase / sirohydrochlorin ferrochelatase
MRHFPIFLDLKGRRVLVVGQGDAAERNAALLRRAGADIVSTSRFDPADLVGCALAVGAGAEEADLLALSDAARAAGVPVNVVDRPKLCSCIMPAIVDRDPITVAISSGGAAPVLARLLRARIEAVVPPAFGRLAALADSFRTEIRRSLPDPSVRRRVLERLLTGRAADLVFAGREDEARETFADALLDRGPAIGMVFLVGARPGAADLLTLRGQRLLGEADVIVHDRQVSDAVLDLARRDAALILVDAEGPSGARLVDLARAGKRVVRLHAGDARMFAPGGAEAAALAAAGIPFEVVPGVAAPPPPAA